MFRKKLKRSFPDMPGALFALLILWFAGFGCSMYRTMNTLHWAKEAYKSGKKAQKQEQKSLEATYRSLSRQQGKVGGGTTMGSADFEQAAKRCLYYLSLNPDSRGVDDALLLLGKSFYELKRYIQAENSLRTLLDTQRKSGYRDDALYYLTLVMIARGEIPQAEQGIERLLDEYPKSKYRPLALYDLAEKLFQMEDYDRALEVFLGLKNNYPKFDLKGQVLLFIARIYYQTGEYQQALDINGQIKEKGSDDEQKRQGLLGMARCRSRMNEHEKALAIYEEALRAAKFPEDRAEALLGINVEYTFLGRKAEALKGFEYLVTEYQRSSYSAAAWYEIGLLYKEFKRNTWIDSIVVDSTSLVIFKMNTKTLEPLLHLTQEQVALELSKLAFRNVRIEDQFSPFIDPAQEQLLEVINLSSIVEQMLYADSTTSADARARLEFLMAEYYQSSGQLDQALAGYERLVFEYPHSIWTPKAALNMALLNAELGDSTRSQETMELVLSQFPDTRYADQARHLLGLPMPERPLGFYLDELAQYTPPRITKPAEAGGRAGEAGGGPAVPGKETYLQMRRRLWWYRLGKGGGA